MLQYGYVCNYGLFYAFNLVFFCQLQGINQSNLINSISFIHLQHVMISISTIVLPNTTKLELVHTICREKKLKNV